MTQHLFYPAFSRYVFLGLFFISIQGNFIMCANKLVQTNSTRLGPLLNAARFNMFINALSMKSKAFLLNLTMILNWVGVAGS